MSGNAGNGNDNKSKLPSQHLLQTWLASTAEVFSGSAGWRFPAHLNFIDADRSSGSILICKIDNSSTADWFKLTQQAELRCCNYLNGEDWGNHGDANIAEMKYNGKPDSYVVGCRFPRGNQQFHWRYFLLPLSTATHSALLTVKQQFNILLIHFSLHFHALFTPLYIVYFRLNWRMNKRTFSMEIESSFADLPICIGLTFRRGMINSRRL